MAVMARGNTFISDQPQELDSTLDFTEISKREECVRNLWEKMKKSLGTDLCSEIMENFFSFI